MTDLPARTGTARETPVDSDEVARAALDATVALSLRVLRGAMGVLLVLFLASGLFTVEPHEVALVRRLGKIQGSPEDRTLEPGAHWAWPVIDEVVRIPARRQEGLATNAFALALTDAEAVSSKPPERKGGIDPERDGYLLTGDANVLHASLAARFQIVDPYAFSSRAIDATALARPILERACERSAAGRPVDELLTTKKEAFLEDVRSQAQTTLESLGAGIKILAVELTRDLSPPPQVRDAFASVARAAQDRDRMKSDALARAAEEKGMARANAARVREMSSSDAKRLRGEIEADAVVFQALLPEWKRNRKGLEDRLLVEALAKVRPEETFVVHPGETVRIKLERDTKDIREEMLRRAKESGQ